MSVMKTSNSLTFGLIYLILLVIVISRQPRMPLFNWDTVPRFIHMCNGSGPFNSSVAKYIASFPLVTIEKGQGNYSNGTMPANYSLQYAEQKIIQACQSIKKINESVTCIIYINTILDWNMYYLHIELLNNPNYWLRDDNGVIVRHHGDASFSQPTDGMLVFDYRQENVVNFWISECVNMTSTKWIDGCFLDKAGDNSFKGYNFSESDLKHFEDGHTEMMQKLQQILINNNQSILITNPIYVINGTFATMIPIFTPTEDNIKTLMNLVNQGQLVEVRTQGNPNCNNIINSLSAFLIGAGQYSYYGCSNGWYVQDGWLIPHKEYNKRLGKPNGKAVLKNEIYTRMFDTGTNVTFNTKNNVGTIEWADGDISVGIEGSKV